MKLGSKNCIEYLSCYLYKFAYFFVAIFGSYLILKDANWCFGDDHEFLCTTAIGKLEPMCRHMGGGRFVPLQHYDYNLLTLFSFGKDVLAHYSLVAMSFLLLTYFWMKISLLICKQDIKSYKLKLFLSVFCFVSFLCNRAVERIFLEVIFPERMVLLLFSIFIYLYLSALRKESVYKYVAAFVVVVYASYVKEPVSGAFCSFALINLFFRPKSLGQRRFFVAIILNFVVYVISYYFLVYKTSASFYNSGRCSLSYIDNITAIFKEQEILIAIFVLGIVRGIKLLFHKDSFRPDFDSLLFMSISYTSAYFFLKLNSDYYFTPSILIGYIVIFYWISFYVDKKRFISVVMSLVCLCSIIINCKSVFNLYKWINEDRRIFIPTISKIIEKYGRSFEICGKTSGNFGDQVLNWHKIVLNTAINYLSKTENKNYISIVDDVDRVLGKDIVIASDFSNMPQNEKDRLNNYLNYNNFVRIYQNYGLSIYVMDRNK